MRSLDIVTLIAFAVAGCAATTNEPQTTRTPTAPTPVASSAPAPPPPPPDPFVVEGAPIKEPLEAPAEPPARRAIPYPAPPPGQPPPPRACGAFAQRVPIIAPRCATRPDLLAALDAALSETDDKKRDARLLGLEACAGAPTGLVRSLRADLAPPACGDAINEPILKTPPPSLADDTYQTLMAQALGARLARVGEGFPLLPPAFDAKIVADHLAGPVTAWRATQLRAIDAARASVAALDGYGKGVALVELGMAQLRVAKSGWRARIPPRLKADVELRQRYYAGIQELLANAIAPGRDTLVAGIDIYGGIGVIDDPRLARARRADTNARPRELPTRRLATLDDLLLPDAPASRGDTVDARLAARLPTFHAERLLPPTAVDDDDVLRAFITRGVPASARRRLAQSSMSNERRLLWARGRLLLGARYLQPFDWDEAAHLANLPDRTDDATLLLALALALRSADMKLSDLPFPPGPRALPPLNLTALDALAASTSPYAALAEYDAALLFDLATPTESAEFRIKDVPRLDAMRDRYRKVAPKLSGPSQTLAANKARPPWSGFILEGIKAADDLDE